MKIVREEFDQDILNHTYVENELNNFIKKHNIKREDIISVKTIKNYPLTIELYYYEE